MKSTHSEALSYQQGQSVADEPDSRKEETMKQQKLTALYERLSREDGDDKAARFIELVNRYESFEDMTTTMLNEFVEKIVVHERDAKGCIDTEQKVDI